MPLDLSDNALTNSARAELVNAVATGHLLPPPPVIPAEHVPPVVVHEARLEPAPINGGMSWQSRLFPSEKPVDISDARAELGRAIAARAEAVAAVAAAAGELARADALIITIEAGLAAHTAEASARVANLSERLRAWVAAGSPGDRPACGSVPGAPTSQAVAEHEAARLARSAVAADHDRARTVHAASVAAVDNARRLVLTAHGQAICARYQAVLGALAELQADGRALLGLTLSGTPALAGLVRERLPASLAPAAGDEHAAARWAAYLRRLDDDPDARF